MFSQTGVYKEPTLDPGIKIRFTVFSKYSFFKTLVGKPVCVELKNDLSLTGTLESVDQYLNVKLSNVDVVDKERFPQLLACKDSFIRGSTIRYIQIPRNEVDTELLQDAARKESQS